MSSIEYNGLKIQQSIVNQQQLDSIAFARDKDEPYTFREWSDASGISNASDPGYKDLYNKYLSAWSSIKSQPTSDSQENTQELFKSFLKQLPIEGTADELRYINNIDFNDKNEVETAISFFSKYLKTTTNKISTNREKVKFKTIKNSIRGSYEGVSLLLRDYIIDLLKDDEVITNQMITPGDREKVIRELAISVQELYDEDGATENNLSKSSRVSIANDVNQQIEYDPYMFIDDTIATQNLLAKYGNALATTASTIQTNSQQEIALNFQPELSTVSSLPQSEFVSYDKQDLNLQNLKKLVQLSNGTMTKYLSSNESGEYITGDLFNGTSNISRYGRTNTEIVFQETNRPVSKQQLGGFYVPSKIGMIDYYSFSAKPIILDQYIQPDKLYTYTALDNYGSTKIDLPVDYIEDFTYLKNNTIESGTPGEISNRVNNLPKFNNYQSTEQSNLFSTTGVSRYDDSYDFWSGDVDSIWANHDVFENNVPNILEIDSRQESMASNAGHIYEWKSDSYGNEYGLLKKIKKYETLTLENFNPPAPVQRCGIMDGDDFIDSYAQRERVSLLSPGSTQNRAAPSWEAVTNGTLNSNARFTNTTNFTSDPYSRVADGRTFFDAECDFDEPEQESLVIDVPKARPGTTFCNFYDGLTFRTLLGMYVEFSTNVGTWTSSGNPPADKIWDCGDFKTVCVEAPLSSVYYKTAENNIVGNTFVTSQLESGDNTQTKTLHEQQSQSGELMIRLNDSSKIGNFMDVCRDVVSRYSTTQINGEIIDIQQELQDNLLDFSVVGDILILKTTHLLVLDKIKHDYAANKILSVSNPIIISREATTNGHKLSEHFYNEYKNEIVLCHVDTTPVESTTGEAYTESQILAKFYIIDVYNFKLTTTTPEIVWHEPGQDILLKSVTNIAQPHVAHNKTTDKYYVVFLCNYSTVASESSSFAIGQITVADKFADQYELTVYTSGVPAKGSIENLSAEDRKIISTNRLSLTEKTLNPSAYFRNSIRNLFQLDLSNFAADEIATLVEVFFDYPDQPDLQATAQPDYTKTRKPVQVYGGFEQGKLLGDSRDPRSHLIEHTYFGSGQKTCRVKIHTIGGKVYDVYITVYGDEQADLTAAFGRTIGTGTALSRAPGLGLEIHNTTAFTNEYGVEHLLIMFKTIEPDYISPVMLRLAEPIREQITYEISGNQDTISRETVLDTGTIDATYTTTTTSQTMVATHESGTVTNDSITQTTPYTPVTTTSSPTTSTATPVNTDNTTQNNNTYYSY